MDKELLLKGRLTEADVDIPGLGTVRVRGLSRAEVMAISELSGETLIERKVLHFAMVDPPLTEEEVSEWRSASPLEEITPVLAKVLALSGMTEGAAKSSVSGIRDDSGTGVHLLPGEGAGNDGGGPYDNDV